MVGAWTHLRPAHGLGPGYEASMKIVSSVVLLALAPHGALAADPPPAPPPPYGEVWGDAPDMAAMGSDPQGAAALSRSAFTVQTKDTVDYIYTVGPGGMAQGDYVRIEDPWGHGMRWSKWGAPQVDAAECSALQPETDVASGSLVTVATSGVATVLLERSTVSHDVHRYAYTDVYLDSGELLEGDTITLRVGDSSTDANCAHQFPDRAFQRWQWRAFEHIADAGWQAVQPYPELQVEAERDAALLWVSGPSFVQAGEPFVLKVTALDRLGNPIPAWGETATVAGAYGGVSKDFDEANQGWLDFGLSIEDEGVHRVEVTAGTFTVSSNPIVVSTAAPEQRLYWGDLHSHHGHTIVYEDGSEVDENHVYARDALGHDLSCESMKMSTVEMDDAVLWAELQRNCSEVTEEGRYLVMLGSEWMGNYSGTSDGHHNIYFDDCVGFHGAHADITGLEGVGSLLQLARDLETSQGTRSVILPHATVSTGRNWTDHDDELRAGVEVYSEWGDTVDTIEAGNISEGLSRGHRFGFFAATDNHDGWMGNPLSFKYELSGLGAFWATDLSRAKIFDAMANRRTFATSGARIVVVFELVEGATTVRSGDEIIARNPTFTWEVHGTDTVAEVGLTAVKLVASSRPEELHQATPMTLDEQSQFAWSEWDGSDYAVYLSVVQSDGEVAYSSPIWISQDCDNEYASDPEGYCEEDTDPGPDDTDTAPPEETDPPDETGDSRADDTGKEEWRKCGCLGGPEGTSSAGLLLGFGLLGGATLRRRRDG